MIEPPTNKISLSSQNSGPDEWLGDGTSWYDPFKTWFETCTFDPLANLTEAQCKLVLGGEQLLWSEQSGPKNIDLTVSLTATALNVTEALPRLHVSGAS
ncbi:uncharacterized protein F5147DRAFT_779531 [Suillus discolor]|uniref:Uncharacterized protein n=1 Tax=Suillus discolor TaxID=1912936 RepID=A0A9P7JNI5_9AGAM|nr:uncharacterized protein F5147DRAFT_779531 [Suillus discolor]KAG2092787.1 hypothetical protein F5147DRAFT_779531 [Suillus discolor]